jgi:methanogenic corrinoid protein MtbC1
MKNIKKSKTNQISGEFKDFYSIGELAMFSGISENSLRIWEKRYDAPIPERLPSGHRRYSKKQLIWLLKVAEAISMGFKTSKVLRSNEEELDFFVRPQIAQKVQKEFDEIIDHILYFRDEKILSLLKAAYKKQAAHSYCDNFLGPLLTLIGQMWADDKLNVRHEHYFSYILEKYLRSLRPKSENGNWVVKKILLCSLEQELHVLGLYMAELICKVNGVEMVFLGANTPVDDIVKTANSMAVDAVGMTMSLSSANIKTEKVIQEMKSQLPDSVKVVVGCKADRVNRSSKPDVVYVKSMKEFQDLIRVGKIDTES